MTSKVNGKTGILTPSISETPENFITEIVLISNDDFANYVLFKVVPAY